MITLNVVTCQNVVVQFSDKIPTDLQTTQSSEIMHYLSPVMYWSLDNSRNHSLKGQQFKTHWTDTITSPKFGPKQLLILHIFCLPLFISFFEDRNFGVNSDRTLVDLLTFKCME